MRQIVIFKFTRIVLKSLRRVFEGIKLMEKDLQSVKKSELGDAPEQNAETSDAAACDVMRSGPGV